MADIEYSLFTFAWFESCSAQQVHREGLVGTLKLRNKQTDISSPQESPRKEYRRCCFYHEWSGEGSTEQEQVVEA